MNIHKSTRLTLLDRQEIWGFIKHGVGRWPTWQNVIESVDQRFIKFSNEQDYKSLFRATAQINVFIRCNAA